MSLRTYGRNSAKRKPETQVEVKNTVHVIPPFKRARITPEIQAQSQPTSPIKIAKRMLGRSKTDSSIGSSTTSTPDNSPARPVTNRPLERTPSLPNALSRSPSKSQSLSSIPEAEPALPRRKSTTTRTYAGTSRTYLVSHPVASTSLSALEEQPGGDEDDDFLGGIRESYASLRSRWGVDNSDDDPYPPPPASPSKSVASARSVSRQNSAVNTPNGSPVKAGRGSKGKGKFVEEPLPLPNGMMNPLKSITELRTKGESRRFLDDVGYLFEGMQRDVGIGLRRTT